MQEKTEVTLLDADGMQRALSRIAYEILERTGKEMEQLVFAGIRTRGWHLARRLVERVADIEGKEIPYFALDVSSFRDDLRRDRMRPQITGWNGDGDRSVVDAKRVIVVDDVLFTGRTVRAALDALTSVARPALIQLAVLIDRGHRELPIRPDYVGKNIPTARSERVRVSVREVDGEDHVRLLKPEA